MNILEEAQDAVESVYEDLKREHFFILNGVNSRYKIRKGVEKGEVHLQIFVTGGNEKFIKKFINLIEKAVKRRHPALERSIEIKVEVLEGQHDSI